MSQTNGSPDDISDHTNGSFRSNGKREGSSNGNGGLNNNNRDDYRMVMKTNGNDKVAEEDPLTGHRKWDINTPKEPKWSQRFASTNFFMLIFLLAYVLQGKFNSFAIQLAFAHLSHLQAVISLTSSALSRPSRNYSTSNQRQSRFYLISPKSAKSVRLSCSHILRDAVTDPGKRRKTLISQVMLSLSCQFQVDCMRNVFVFARCIRLSFPAFSIRLAVIQSRCER